MIVGIFIIIQLFNIIMKYDVIIIKKPDDIVVSLLHKNLNYSEASSSASNINSRCLVNFNCVFATTGSWQTGLKYPLE